jgi:hypothetical protein
VDPVSFGCRWKELLSQSLKETKEEYEASTKEMKWNPRSVPPPLLAYDHLGSETIGADAMLYLANELYVRGQSMMFPGFAFPADILPSEWA